MSSLPGPTRLVHITTAPQALWAFFHGQIGFMQAQGFDVQALSSPGELLDRFARREAIPVHAVPMPRRISPFQDLVAVLRIYRRLVRLEPHIVHAHTPKGGLLGMIAAWAARVPVRIYHIHGLPFTSASGSKRVVLRWSERISCLLAHRVLCVSPSIRQVAVESRICPARKVIVPASGSANGVDAAATFNPERFDTPARAEARLRLGIPRDALVIGFVGRIVRDKGVPELAAAWEAIRDELPAAHLLVVGLFEPQDPVPERVENALRSDPRIHLIGFSDDLPALYAVMDIVVLPSYREGLPVVPLEAAAMALPVVATRIPGCVDAVQDGVTGTLVPPRAAEALAGAIRAYALRSDLRRRHGDAGRARVLREFVPEAIWEATLQEYLSFLRTANLPLPARQAPREAMA